MDLLSPACPLLGMEPATQARALTRNQLVTSWLMDQCSVTELYWLGLSAHLNLLILR